MCSSDLFRLQLEPGAPPAPVMFPFPWMLFLTQGELRVEDVGSVAAGEFYWSRAGVSAVLGAGSEGTSGIVISTEERDGPTP